MNEIVNNIADYVLVSVLVPNLLFVVRYFLYSPYERTREGRNLLYSKLSISSLIIIILLSLFLGPDYPFRPVIRLLTFGTVAYFYWIELSQLISVQRRYPYSRFKR